MLLEISWMHLIILILSSFRLTHLIVSDKITSFIREPFVTVTFEEDDSEQMIPRVEIKGTGWRYWVGTLISCHWCTGIWTSLVIVTLYSLLPASFPLLVILAVAGAASILSSKL